MPTRRVCVVLGVVIFFVLFTLGALVTALMAQNLIDQLASQQGLEPSNCTIVNVTVTEVERRNSHRHRKEFVIVDWEVIATTWNSSAVNHTHITKVFDFQEYQQYNRTHPNGTLACWCDPTIPRCLWTILYPHLMGEARYWIIYISVVCWSMFSLAVLGWVSLCNWFSQFRACTWVWGPRPFRVSDWTPDPRCCDPTEEWD